MQGCSPFHPGATPRNVSAIYGAIVETAKYMRSSGVSISTGILSAIGISSGDTRWKMFLAPAAFLISFDGLIVARQLQVLHVLPVLVSPLCVHVEIAVNLDGHLFARHVTLFLMSSDFLQYDSYNVVILDSRDCGLHRHAFIRGLYLGRGEIPRCFFLRITSSAKHAALLQK